MTNRERLVDAGVLKQDAVLTPEQEQAIEALTPEEIDVLLSVKNKLQDVFPPEELAAPITHHH